MKKILVFALSAFGLLGCQDNKTTDVSNTVATDGPSARFTVFDPLNHAWETGMNTCGTGCHNTAATDGTENGPDLSTKDKFYTNLVNRSVAVNYSSWISARSGNCNSIKFIVPGSPDEGTLLQSFNAYSADYLLASKGCYSSYTAHGAKDINPSPESYNSLYFWIKNGAVSALDKKTWDGGTAAINLDTTYTANASDGFKPIPGPLFSLKPTISAVYQVRAQCSGIRIVLLGPMGTDGLLTSEVANSQEQGTTNLNGFEMGSLNLKAGKEYLVSIHSLRVGPTEICPLATTKISIKAELN